MYSGAGRGCRCPRPGTRAPWLASSTPSSPTGHRRTPSPTWPTPATSRSGIPVPARSSRPREPAPDRTPSSTSPPPSVAARRRSATTVTDWEAPHTVVLEASNKVMRLHDEIVVDRVGPDTLITYDVRITLRGPLKVFDGLLERRFRPTGERAAAGLRERGAAPPLTRARSCATRMNRGRGLILDESVGAADDRWCCAADPPACRTIWSRSGAACIGSRRSVSISRRPTPSSSRRIDGLDLEVTTYDGFSGVGAVLRGARPGRSYCSGPTWTRSRSPRRLASTSRRTVLGCTRAATTSTWRCWSVRLVCCMCLPSRRGGIGRVHVPTRGGGLLRRAAHDRRRRPHARGCASRCRVRAPRRARADRSRCRGHASRSAPRVGRHGCTSWCTERAVTARVPHLARDPVPVAAEIVTALNAVVTRQFDVFDPVVISVGVLHAGTAHNVIADSARLEATMRSFSATTRERLAEATTRAARGIADAHGLRAEAWVETMYPATVNDPDAAARCAAGRGAACSVRSGSRSSPTRSRGPRTSRSSSKPCRGRWRSSGVCVPERDPATAPYNHSPRALHDDGLLADGARPPRRRSHSSTWGLRSARCVCSAVTKRCAGGESAVSDAVMTAISRWTTGARSVRVTSRGRREQRQHQLGERADTEAGRNDAAGGGAATLNQLAPSFGGQLLQPLDLAYEDARRVHNGLVDKRPARDRAMPRHGRRRGRGQAGADHRPRGRGARRRPQRRRPGDDRRRADDRSRR